MPTHSFTHTHTHTQAARLPRVFRLPLVNQFVKRVFGNGSRLLTVIVSVLVLLGLFSLVAVQVFGYLPVEEGCEKTGSAQFADFFTVSFNAVPRAKKNNFYTALYCYIHLDPLHVIGEKKRKKNILCIGAFNMI